MVACIQATGTIKYYRNTNVTDLSRRLCISFVPLTQISPVLSKRLSAKWIVKKPNIPSIIAKGGVRCHAIVLTAHYSKTPTVWKRAFVWKPLCQKQTPTLPFAAPNPPTPTLTPFRSKWHSPIDYILSAFILVFLDQPTSKDSGDVGSC